jgi:phosphatidylserine decarboxylase
VWNGVNIPAYGAQAWRLDFRARDIRLERFAEMARFNYGSTVIMLFPANVFAIDALAPESPTRLGARLGRVVRG